MKIIEIQAQFLTQLRKGEGQAIMQLYEQAFDYCASFVLKNSGTLEDAKDVFQEVLLVFIKKLRDKEFVIEYDFKAYLYKITSNLWLKRLNAQKKIGLYLVVDEPKARIDLVAKDDLPEKKALEKRHQLLYASLKQLKEDCQQLLHYTFFDKRSNFEIAQIMGFTSNNFVSQKRVRCLKYLKKKMGK